MLETCRFTYLGRSRGTDGRSFGRPNGALERDRDDWLVCTGAGQMTVDQAVDGRFDAPAARGGTRPRRVINERHVTSPKRGAAPIA